MIAVWKGLSFTLFGVLFALGMVFYQYKLWKALKDDFLKKELVGMVWFSSFFGILGGRLVFVLSKWSEIGSDPLVWFLFWRHAGFSWLGFYFFWIASVWVYSRLKKRACWLVLEEATRPILGWLAFGYLGLFFSSSFELFPILSLFLFFSFLYFLSGWMEKRYRSWPWYPSGKKGFLFLAINFSFFVPIFLLDFINRGRLYSEDILYILWIVFVLICLFVLSERKLSFLDKRRK